MQRGPPFAFTADEQDVVVQGVRPYPDGSASVDGQVPIRDLNRMMDWRLPDEEATTIAGLVIHEARMIPDPGQSFTFHGFERPDMKMMMAGKAAITADIEVMEGASRYRIKPTLSMNAKGEVTGNEVPLKVSGRKASLKELNRETESVTLFVEPAPGAALPRDTVLLDISIKRLIILVWAGTVLITVGAFLSVWKRSRA